MTTTLAVVLLFVAFFNAASLTIACVLGAGFTTRGGWSYAPGAWYDVLTFTMSVMQFCRDCLTVAAVVVWVLR